MFPHADQFAREDACFSRGLLGLGGIALGALVGLQDVGAGFGFEGFEVGQVAVEFAAVGADEGVAFPILTRMVSGGLRRTDARVAGALPALRAMGRRRNVVLPPSLTPGGQVGCVSGDHRPQRPKSKLPQAFIVLSAYRVWTWRGVE